MPGIAIQAVAGKIPRGGIRLLAMARGKHPDEFRMHESPFAEGATYLHTRDLRRAVSHWEQQADCPDAPDEAESVRLLRRFSFHQSYRDMWAVSGNLNAVHEGKDPPDR